MKHNQQRFFEAISAIDAEAIDLTTLISLADQLTSNNEADYALLLYKYWLLANPTHALRHVPAFNCGSWLLSQGNLTAALHFLSVATKSAPMFFPARLNLALALERVNELDKAVAELNHVADASRNGIPVDQSNEIFALKNLARIQRHRAPISAEQALARAIELDPTQQELLQHWVHGRQERCAWPVLKPLGALQAHEVLANMKPLSMSALCDHPWLQLATAWRYTDEIIHSGSICETVGHWPPPTPGNMEKIRVGYLSSDFCSHAIGYLISDIFELHNRSRFEVTVFNLSERRNDPIQLKIMAGVDRWIDLHGKSDAEAAKAILTSQTDILLDMNGHTNYQRPRLLAMKPAPIIANWLGYPGSMGADAHQYIIADNFIIPPTHEKYYSEKVLRLPCYQPNGRLFHVPEVQRTREELHLPEGAFVFCCFNGAIKITAPVFGRWMSVLKQVPSSVLWLRGAGNDTECTLRQQAQDHGVDGERLIFLPFCTNTEYLGCHRYADVFLDTFPYGAHTTASDALRMGVPIVTLTGTSFASRVCGSLSSAAGLTDLICSTPEEYVFKAVEMGINKTWRDQVRNKLRAQLSDCILFNPKNLTTHLESLFEHMWGQYCTGAMHTPQRPDIARLFSLAGSKDQELQNISEHHGCGHYDLMYE